MDELSKDCFLEASCVDGSCPFNLDVESRQLYFPEIYGCEDCDSNQGECRNCIFYETEECLKRKSSINEENVSMRPMRVLVACEESQTVCKSFREKGHEAYSCDLIDCSGGHPEWHIKCDALKLLDGNCHEFKTEDGVTHKHTQWDLLIAHPPCTYMSNAGACRMYPKKGVVDQKRLAKAMEAKTLFMKFLECDCERICVENPVPLSIVGLPKQTQMIQPYMFGEPWSKKTYLWLKNLPMLKPTKILQDYKPYVSCGTSHNKGNKEKAGFSRSGGASKVRSRSFKGISDAMADQWGSLNRRNGDDC